MEKRKIHAILIVYSRSINEKTLTDDYLIKIREAAPGANIVRVPGQKEWDRLKSNEKVLKAEVVYGTMYGDWIKALPNLRWIQLASAGADRLVNSPELKERNILLTNSSGVHAIPIAEHIMALMLTLSRDIQRSVRRQIKHEWAHTDHWVNMGELNGATMGLIGVGRIGQMTAKKAKGLDMKVLGIRRNPKLSVPFVDQVYGPDGLMDVLASSDWVVIATPLTAETKGMIGENELKVMKKSAGIINIARGGVIQEKALVRALKKGWIAGAGLDVFEKEPLPEDSPLWDMENVVITPHDAGASPYHLDRRFEIFTENLRRYQSGSELINLVDKNLGY